MQVKYSELRYTMQTLKCLKDKFFCPVPQVFLSLINGAGKRYRKKLLELIILGVNLQMMMYYLQFNIHASFPCF